jgi:hypothetical protein
MCQYKTWFQSDEGYTIQCYQCKRIQIGFGMIALNFTPGEFEDFRVYIFHVYGSRNPSEHPKSKSIVIPTKMVNLNIILSGEELKSLHRILEYTDNEMRATNILSAFEDFGSG